MLPLIYDSQRALGLLRLGTGIPDATFRPGQEEAIRHVVEGRGRLAVVQKTGWGKSFVYFIANRLLREAGAGPGLLVSPLLSLMRNQIEAATRMGIRARRITSDNVDQWYKSGGDAGPRRSGCPAHRSRTAGQRTLPNRRPGGIR